MNYAQALRLGLNPAQPDMVAVVGGGGKSSTVFRLGLDLAAAGKRAVITHTARIAAFQVRWAPAVVAVDLAPEAEDAELPLAAIAQALDRHGTCLLTGPQVGDRRLGLPPAAIDRLVRHAAELGLQAVSIEADGSKMRPVKAPAEHEPVLPATTTLLCPVLGLDAIGAPLHPRWVHRPELVRSVLGLPAAEEVALTPAMAARLLIDPAGGAKALPAGARLLPLLNKADTPLRLAYARLAASLLAATGQPSLLTVAGSTPAEPPGSDPVEPTKVEPAADFAGGLRGEPVRERWGSIAVVVLAAGTSVRMGRPKQVEVVDGEPMVARAVRIALAAGVGPVYVITGAHAESVGEVVRAEQETAAWQRIRQAQRAANLPDAGSESPVAVVHNSAWGEGQASSVRRAIEVLPPSVQAAIFMPVDQPFLNPLLLHRLALAWRAGADLVAPAVDGELRGAPALFDRSTFPDLSRLEGDTGGRVILKRRPSAVTLVPASADWLRDIDSPSDLP